MGLEADAEAVGEVEVVGGFEFLEGGDADGVGEVVGGGADEVFYGVDEFDELFGGDGEGDGFGVGGCGGVWCVCDLGCGDEEVGDGGKHGFGAVGPCVAVLGYVVEEVGVEVGVGVDFVGEEGEGFEGVEVGGVALEVFAGVLGGLECGFEVVEVGVEVVEAVGDVGDGVFGHGDGGLECDVELLEVLVDEDVGDAVVAGGGEAAALDPPVDG